LCSLFQRVWTIGLDATYSAYVDQILTCNCYAQYIESYCKHLCSLYRVPPMHLITSGIFRGRYVTHCSISLICISCRIDDCSFLFIFFSYLKFHLRYKVFILDMTYIIWSSSNMLLSVHYHWGGK
jgi:hypothetical protein